MIYKGLQLFADAGTLVNTSSNYVNAYSGEATEFDSKNSLSAGMKSYYNTELLENAKSEYYFSQLGRKQNLPAGRGKIVEWRKWNTLPQAKQLTEGVVPTGEKFGQSSISTAINQYGTYVSISDQLELHSIDDVILGATEELGASAGLTQDTLVRDELMTGTNVIYADAVNCTSSDSYVSTPNTRYKLTQSNTAMCKLTPDMVNKAATWLKKQKAPKINGKYVAVIHPSVAYDLRNSKEWIDSHKYASVTEIFNGEIGELHGVRFIESTQAPVLQGDALFGTSRYLTVGAYSNASSASATAGYGTASAYMLTIDEDLDASEITKEYALALIGREVNLQDISDSNALYGTYTIKGVNINSNYVFLDRDIAGFSVADGDYILPGEGGKELKSEDCQNAVYATLFFGKDAFGLIDPEGAGMEMIIKNKSDIGGPLNQFSTIGYKFSQSTKILYQDRLVRVESCSAYSASDAAN